MSDQYPKLDDNLFAYITSEVDHDMREGQENRIRWNNRSMLMALNTIAALKAQLPDGMQHCTIKFIECEKGHGRLTATNWIDNGCSKCRIDELEAEVDELKCTLGDEEAAHQDTLRLWNEEKSRLDELENMIAHGNMVDYLELAGLGIMQYGSLRSAIDARRNK